MENVNDPVTALREDECWEHLRAHQLGRLVTRVGDVVDIFPVNYVVDGESIVFRTAEGGKLAGLTINASVLFEVDEYTADDAWSVVVRGQAHRIADEEELAAVEQLPLAPMVPTLKLNHIRITPDSVTGRSFRRGPEPGVFDVHPY
ncbi:pyridoxamine 5'-phosphate oxidase family protein [Leucobacter sp. CSA1]|uniref:Pyridoxamine 5'-phosphate oxidase family protein n=1 Tax=Leucobacter chromiisoli TaxID=2796471 RepID=A0A934Q3T2_9MICO|nr:pyridoxamine 5'-phosphate oxidase family protein [Leucobacter chromiisoli]MBK0417930.1 pyridoxamine 5'-phosphate oxidase family protein [Leucobacter chromiisoli]